MGKKRASSKNKSVKSRVKSSLKIFECTFENCEKTYISDYSLRRHEETHSVYSWYKCNQCPKNYKNSESLRKHEKRHKVASFQCNICFMLFSTQLYFDNHLRLHENEKKVHTRNLRRKVPKNLSLKSLDYIKPGSLGDKVPIWKPEVKSIKEEFLEEEEEENNISQANISFECPSRGCYQKFPLRVQLNFHYQKVHSSQFMMKNDEQHM